MDNERPTTKRKKQITLSEAIAHFVTKDDARLTTKGSATLIQGSSLGRVKLHHLKTSAIRAWAERRLEFVRLARVMQDLRLIRFAYEAARHDFGLTLPDNPAMGFTLNERRRHLTAAELSRICQALEDEPALRAMVIVAAETGLSRGALSNLQWRDVDLDAATASLRDRSAGPIVREVSLSPTAIEALEPLSRRSHRAFPVRVDRVRWSWMAACRRAGVKDVKFYEARHVLQYEGRQK